MNSYANDVDKDHLYDIGSGKCASKETKDFFLHVHENGIKLRQAFTNDCIRDPNRFEEKITLQKLHTFASEGQRYKMKANEQLADVKMERDLFGSILFMSLQHQIDEQRIVATDPKHVDVTIVDGMFFFALT